MYADDITLLVSSEDPVRLIEADVANAEIVEASLARNHLRLCRPKSYNLVVSPGLITGSLFRRGPREHNQAGRGVSTLDTERGRLIDITPNEELLAQRIFPKSFRDKLPFEWKEDMVILGVIIDPF